MVSGKWVLKGVWGHRFPAMTSFGCLNKQLFPTRCKGPCICFFLHEGKRNTSSENSTSGLYLLDSRGGLYLPQNSSDMSHGRENSLVHAQPPWCAFMGRWVGSKAWTLKLTGLLFALVGSQLSVSNVQVCWAVPTVGWVSKVWACTGHEGLAGAAAEPLEVCAGGRAKPLVCLIYLRLTGSSWNSCGNWSCGWWLSLALRIGEETNVADL